eukprot:4921305-Prymnesium_polylepis.1
MRHAVVRQSVANGSHTGGLERATRSQGAERYLHRAPTAATRRGPSRQTGRPAKKRHGPPARRLPYLDGLPYLTGGAHPPATPPPVEPLPPRLPPLPLRPSPLLPPPLLRPPPPSWPRAPPPPRASAPTPLEGRPLRRAVQHNGAIRN